MRGMAGDELMSGADEVGGGGGGGGDAGAGGVSGGDGGAVEAKEDEGTVESIG